MMKDVFTIGQYRKFFDILLAQEKGAVIWHCSAGKDRTGIGAALILFALGVDPEAVRADYLASNDFLADRTEKFVANAAADGADQRVCDELRIWCGVCPEYFDTAMRSVQRNWGGMDGLMKNGLAMTGAKLEKMRALYLI